MNKKWVAGISFGVCVLLVVWVLATAASVASEAGRMDSMLKADINEHKTVQVVERQLADAGYSVHTVSAGLKGEGPKHSLIVYTTWLTVDVGFDASGAMIRYHLDRTS